jgi:hypothetical protein
MDSGSDNSDDSGWRSSNYNNNNSVHGYNHYKDQRQDMGRGGQESHLYVALHNINGEKVAKGIVQAIEAGDSLQGLVLSPSEEAILIKEVYVPSEEVYELYLYNMGDCLNKVIRWPKKLLEEMAEAPEFGERFVQQQPSLWSSRSAQSGFAPHTMSFIASMEEVRGNQVHGRPYCHRTRAQRRPRGPRVIEKPRKERLSLDCVIMDKEKVLCSQRCLHDIQAKDILILQCLSLESPKYERRLTWIIDTLRSFMTVHRTLNMQDRVKCVTRISGKRVCNACYALAVGYS